MSVLCKMTAVQLCVLLWLGQCAFALVEVGTTGSGCTGALENADVLQCQQHAVEKGVPYIVVQMMSKPDGCYVVNDCTRFSIPSGCTNGQVIRIDNTPVTVVGSGCDDDLSCLCKDTGTPDPPLPVIAPVIVVAKKSADTCDAVVSEARCLEYAVSKGLRFAPHQSGKEAHGCIAAGQYVLYSDDGTKERCGADEDIYDCICVPDTPIPPTNPPATNPPRTEVPKTNAPPTNPPPTNPPPTDPPATNPPTNPPPTQAPATTAPATNPPATNAPATNPPSTKPPATTVPATFAPSTSAPLTAAPRTVSPPTRTPTALPTRVPLTLPPATEEPPVLLPEPVATTAPSPLTSGKAIPGEAGTVLAGMSAVSAASAGRLALLSGAGDCDKQREDDDEYLPWTLHPTRLVVLDSMWIGAVVGNSVICFGFALLAWLVLVAAQFIVPCLAEDVRLTLDTQGLLRLPSSIIFVFRILYQGSSLASLRMMVSPHHWYYLIIGLSGAIACTVVPIIVFFSVWHAVPHFARYREDEGEISWFKCFMLGRGEWVSTKRKRHFVQRYSTILRGYKERYAWWSIVDFSSMFLLSIANASVPTALSHCCAFRVATCVILLLLCAATLACDPYHRPRDRIFMPLILLTQAISGVFVAAGFCNDKTYHTHSDEWMFTAASTTLSVAQILLILKLALDGLCETFVICTKRRELLQQREFEESEEASEVMRPKDTTTPSSQAKESPSDGCAHALYEVTQSELDVSHAHLPPSVSVGADPRGPNTYHALSEGTLDQSTSTIVGTAGAGSGHPLAWNRKGYQASRLTGNVKPPSSRIMMQVEVDTELQVQNTPIKPGRTGQMKGSESAFSTRSDPLMDHFSL